MSGGYGPWAAGIGDGERLARTRAMRALVFMLCGPTHPLVIALRDAEYDQAAAARALEELDRLPALRKRRLLATYSALAVSARRDAKGAP